MNQEIFNRYNEQMDEAQERNKLMMIAFKKSKERKVNPVVSGIVVLFFIGLTYTIFNPVVFDNTVNAVMAFGK